MIDHDRRTFLRAIGAGSIGAIGSAYASETAAGQTTITIEGGGDDVWNDYDEFHYYYEELTGDFDVTVNVESQENTGEYARAGLMVRQSLADDEEHAMIRKTPEHETSFQWRSDGGSQAVSTTSDGGSGESEVSGGTVSATWQRLVRSGDTIEAYGSDDGSDWTLIADISPGEIDFADSAYVGLAVCSYNSGTLCTAEFSNLSGVSPSSNTDVGNVDVSGSVSESTDDANVVVSTGSASSVGATSATLSGSLDDPGGASSADVSFEYRQTGASSWSSTSSQTLSSGGSFSEGVSGLNGDTDYEFRAVADASDGDSDTGSTNTFSTTSSGGSGVITVEGAGADIWNEADEFHYYYAQVSGDFDVTVNVDSLEDTDAYAKAGLMLRESLSADAINAMVRETPGHDTGAQWRGSPGAVSESTTSNEGEDESEISGGTMAADYQRLVRSGDVIEAYGSDDGNDWTLIADLDASVVDVSDTAYLGLAVTSHNAGTLCTAEFSELSGLSPTNNQDVGAVDVAGSVTDDGGTTDPDPIVTTGSASNVSTDSATLNGSADSLGSASSADVGFEYRETGASSWTATATQSVSSTGSFSESVSGLASDTDYEFRATLSASDGDADTGATTSFDTDSEDGGDGTTDGAYFHYEDGFADTSWFDDSVDVYRIQNATRSEVESAFSATGARLVVFETSGTIDLGGNELEISEDQCWVAGQTAPSPGITFTNGQVQIDADDCVVQHIRSRIGPGSGGDIQSNDSFNTQDDTQNNVVDHVTTSWGTDECLSVGYDTNNTTLSNCLVYEGLYDPYGDESDHNYATLVGDGADNVALLGNVWAKTRGRVPRLKSGTRTALANNIMYFFNEATNMDGDTEASIVGNVYIPQDLGDTVIEGGNAYLEDNVTDPSSTPLTGGTSELSSRPLWPSGLSAMASGNVESHNLSYAGARPDDRTSNDSRIVDEIQNRAGDEHTDSPYDYWIGDHEEVGGYPQLPENTHSLTVPNSGLRDWLDQWALAVEESGASPP